MCVYGSVTTITRNCVHRSSPNWSVGEGSDHLKLVKFWPSCAPGKGVCGAGRKFLAQCLRLSESFFHLTTAARWVIAAFPYRLLLQFSRPPFHAPFLILASSVSIPLIQRMRSLLQTSKTLNEQSARGILLITVLTFISLSIPLPSLASSSTLSITSAMRGVNLSILQVS